jgi:hypothetical protein
MPPLDERYFVWLYSLVADPTIKDRDLTYWNLLKQLYETEFVWIVYRDENRVEDGKQLRLGFLRSEGLHREDVDPHWVDLGCSFLELAIAMADRLRFEIDPDSHIAYWFWEVLMKNIGLSKYNDAHRHMRKHIEDVVNRVMFRQYEPDGRGGFYPLKHPDGDQRQVELWYQLSAYVNEYLGLS